MGSVNGGFERCEMWVLTSCYRSMIYVEGDATMSTYLDSEGKNRSALNIVERKFSSSIPTPALTAPSGKLEILKRPEDAPAS
jgi:hypothetical protein